MKYVVKWTGTDGLIRPASGSATFKTADDWIWSYARFFDWLQQHQRDDFIVIFDLLDPFDSVIVEQLKVHLAKFGQANFLFTTVLPVDANYYIGIKDPLNSGRRMTWSDVGLDLTPVEPSIQVYRKEIIIFVGQPGGQRDEVANAMSIQRDFRMVDDNVPDDELMSIVDAGIRTGFVRLIANDTNHSTKLRQRYFDIADRIKANIIIMWFTNPTLGPVDVETMEKINQYIAEFERPEEMKIDNARYTLVQSN